MARGRMIDREIYSHEKLMDVPIETRYFYQGLIVWADDDGRIKANPKYLKSKIFPSDNITEPKISGMVDALASIGCLLVYQVGDDRFIQHPKWERWQKIRKDRYKASDCPPPVDGCHLVVSGLTNGVRNLTYPNQTQPNPTKEENGHSPEIVFKVPIRKPFQKPSPDEVAEYAKTIGFDLSGQKFCDYYESKGWVVGKSPMKDWKACVRTWKQNGYGSTTGGGFNGTKRDDGFATAKPGKYPD